jgi:hypothetical protein
MAASLIEELPKIVAEGKKEVERILERLASPQKLTLQTNELVLPSKDVSGLFRGKVPDVGAGGEFQLIKERQETLAGFEPGQMPLAAKEKAAAEVSRDRVLFWPITSSAPSGGLARASTRPEIGRARRSAARMAISSECCF